MSRYTNQKTEIGRIDEKEIEGEKDQNQVVYRKPTLKLTQIGYKVKW